MNIKYYFEFKGLDEVLNRVEILTKDPVSPKEIIVQRSPFVLEYPQKNKLDVIGTSGFKARFISTEIFQFTDLHTDDMQGYMVKFYRKNKLFWLGYLDSELYTETLTDYPPYPVEFSGSDMNVLDRLKFRDLSENKFTDIASLIGQLKRCFDKLRLPFEKLYIASSTTADNVELNIGETVLHRLYIQSVNFYDEDEEPMDCRTVIESILQPFGLMITQREANLYIYDYNSVSVNSNMKKYDFSTLNYEGDETVRFEIGDITDIGFASTNSSYGFDEMINNVKITSSLYGNSGMIDISITKDKMEDLIESNMGRDYDQYYYSKHPNVENISGKFAVFSRDGESDVDGCFMAYQPDPENISPMFRVRCPTYMIGTDALYYMRLKMQAYINTRGNPFDTNAGIKEHENGGTIKLHCNLYVTDSSGNILRYCDLSVLNGKYWVESSIVPQGRFILWFSNSNAATGLALDSWIGNADVSTPMYDKLRIEFIDGAGKGIRIPINEISGYFVFEITNKCRIVNPIEDKGGTENILPVDMVKNIFLNDISMELIGEDKENVSTDDYEFNSYINKGVKMDFDEVTLKCISANEEKIPIGKANILKKVDRGHQLQPSFTRSGQTDILERLLMMTIHSNFSQKNRMFNIDIKMTDNPIMSYCTYKSLMDGNFIVTGCSMDFDNASTTIHATDFREDYMQLSNIPYS